jgi:hypothetical protein
MANVALAFSRFIANTFADTYSRIGLPEPYETDP